MKRARLSVWRLKASWESATIMITVQWTPRHMKLSTTRLILRRPLYRVRSPVNIVRAAGFLKLADSWNRPHQVVMWTFSETFGKGMF
ncbi:hypothetical protein E2C01_093736 [Portunus trituberculatus]|uniref:Uncharacterized protein n=1 Tax=Portunus trituberculatus TaxID=210409 RepID=A0A5B7JUA7_PORTR|nr:hypothetical protein [Portunus trituberculatus]